MIHHDHKYPIVDPTSQRARILELEAKNAALREVLEDALEHWRLGVAQDWTEWRKDKQRVRAALAQNGDSGE